jgi:hypothetical protein
VVGKIVFFQFKTFEAPDPGQKQKSCLARQLHVFLPCGFNKISLPANHKAASFFQLRPANPLRRRGLFFATGQDD